MAEIIDFKTADLDATLDIETALIFGADSQSDTVPAPRRLSVVADALRQRSEVVKNKTIDDTNAIDPDAITGLATVATTGAYSDLSGAPTVTGTNTGDQLTFKTIAVSGQSDVVADSTTDTLTLVAGANITLTTNAGTDSITIASSGGGGGGGLSDGDYGEVVVSGTGTAMAIDVLTTRGDLFTRGASANARLPIGTSGYHVQSDGTDAAWAGFLQSGSGAVTRTWQNKARDRCTAADFGAVGNGTTNDTTALTNALASGAKIVELGAGTFKITSGLTVPFGVSLVGQGYTAENGTDAATVILKSFNGTGIILSESAQIKNLQVKGDTGNTGDGIQVTGGRCVISEVTTSRQGGNGIIIGSASNATLNANIWRLNNIISIYNGGHGVYINHVNATTSGTFPLGAPDVNAGTACNLDLANNTGDGLRVGNAIDCSFFGVVSQTNSGNGIKLTTSARGHHFYRAYTEGNSTSAITVDSGANDNVFIGNRATTTASGWVDNGTRNFMLQTNTNVADTYIIGKKAAVADFAAAAKPGYDMYADTGAIMAARVYGQQGTGSGGELHLQTKRNGNTEIDRLVIDQNGDVRLINSATGMTFGKAAFDTTTTGVSVYSTLGRIDLVNSGTSATTVNAFYNANGQVGSISTSASATTFSTSSDVALKTNIEDAADAGAFLDAVRVRRFDFKADGHHVEFGFIAQELNEVAPNAVTQGETWGVDPTKELIAALIKEVQSLRKRISAIEAGA